MVFIFPYFSIRCSLIKTSYVISPFSSVAFLSSVALKLISPYVFIHFFRLSSQKLSQHEEQLFLVAIRVCHTATQYLPCFHLLSVCNKNIIFTALVTLTMSLDRRRVLPKVEE